MLDYVTLCRFFFTANIGGAIEEQRLGTAECYLAGVLKQLPIEQALTRNRMINSVSERLVDDGQERPL